MKRTIFTSTISFSDAERKAILAGCNPVGKALNKKNQYVVFARY